MHVHFLGCLPLCCLVISMASLIAMWLPSCTLLSALPAALVLETGHISGHCFVGDRSKSRVVRAQTSTSQMYSWGAGPGKMVPLPSKSGKSCIPFSFPVLMAQWRLQGRILFQDLPTSPMPVVRGTQVLDCQGDPALSRKRLLGWLFSIATELITRVMQLCGK